MRAAMLFDTTGPPRVIELPPPSVDDGSVLPFPIHAPGLDLPAAGERGPGTLVRVSAATLNPVDLHIASGGFFQGVPQFPYVPGAEGVGTVLASQSWDPGSRVRFETGHAGYGSNGSVCEQVVVHPDSLSAIPEGLPFNVAAAAGGAGVTAWRVLQVADIRPEDSVLVLGATGAVGKIAVQLARRFGARRVIGGGRNQSSLERVLELGADDVIDVSTDPRHTLAARFASACDGGPDVVIDPLWGEPSLAAIDAAAFGCRFVNFGQAAGPCLDVASAAIRNRRVRITGISTAMDPMSVRRDACQAVLEAVAAGQVTVDHEVFELDDVAQAWERQKASAGQRVVIRSVELSD